MPPKKKSSARSRARSNSLVNTASSSSESPISVVFGRVVFIKHILLFAVDSGTEFNSLHFFFELRRVNSAWYDTIHNYVDAEIWAPLIRQAHTLTLLDHDTSDLQQHSGGQEVSIAKQLFCRSADDTTAAHLDVIRLFVDKGLELKKPFAKSTSAEWHDVLDVKGLVLFPHEQHLLSAFGYAFITNNYALLQLLLELDPDCGNAPFTVLAVDELKRHNVDRCVVTATPLYFAALGMDEKMLDFLLLSVDGVRDGSVELVAEDEGEGEEEEEDEEYFDEEENFDEELEEDDEIDAAVGSDDDDDDSVGESAKDPSDFSKTSALSICLVNYAARNKWERGWHYITLLLGRCGSAAARTAALNRCSPSPLLLAAQCRDLPLLRLCLEHRMSPNVPGRPYSAVGDATSCCCNGFRGCCDVCVCHDGRHDEGTWLPAELALRYVSRCDNDGCECKKRAEFDAQKAVACLKLLLDHDAEVPVVGELEDECVNESEILHEACPPAIAAAMVGDVELLRKAGGQQLALRFFKLRGAQPVSALTAAAANGHAAVVRLLIDELKIPLHFFLFGDVLLHQERVDALSFLTFFGGSKQKQRNDDDVREQWLRVNPLDPPTRHFLYRLRSLSSSNAVNQYIDELEQRLQQQFSEFAAACRSGSVQRVKSCIKKNGLSRCHWPDTDALDFVKEATDEASGEKRQVVDPDAFVRDQKPLPAWAPQMLGVPDGSVIGERDYSWTACSKMMLQKVFCYTPAASRQKIVELLLEHMNASDYNCM